jgi:processive 1,2-diacylglycerol beta-glucosyltransferase
MRICFAFEGLFPGEDRAARHVEALARRFALKGHHVSVVTTSFPGERDPEEVEVLRLPHAPKASADKDEKLLQKTIVRHLKGEKVDLVFAESLTPLSAVTVKAARECRIPTIVRVLCDREGIVHAFAEGPRTAQKTIKKKVTALLEHATVVAASSPRCERLVKPYFDGETRVIEKCVDLNVFRSGRTTRRDLDAFLGEHEARGRRILLYAREKLRESTPTRILPLLAPLRGYAADILFMVVGELEGEGLVEEAESVGVSDLVRAPGPLEGRDFFAAYEAASLFLVPPDSQASARELLEAMAMRNPVVCFPKTAEGAGEVVIPGETALVLDAESPDEQARQLGELLQDDARLDALAAGALEMARRHELQAAIAQVENLCQEVLNMPPETLEPEEAPSAAPAEEPAEKENASMAPPEDRAEAPRRRRRRRTEPDEDETTPVEGPAHRFDPDTDRSADESEDDVSVRAREVAREGREGREAREGRRGRDRRRRRRGREDDGVEELGATTGIDVLDVPRRRDNEARRSSGLEPGLTLRDLMPFLRPPKTLLVLGATTGSGHARAAAAIYEGLKGTDRNLSVRQVDLLDMVSKVYRPPFVRARLEELARCQSLYGAPFETVDGYDDQLPEDLEEFLAKVFDEKLDKLVVDKRPDQIVVTHWLPLRYLAKLREVEKLQAGVIAMLCDPDVHDLWLSDVVDHYLVPGEAARTRLIGRDVDASSVTVTGFPVAAAFAELPSRDKALRELDLKQQNPTVLLRPGGIGATERILDLVRKLFDLEVPLNLLLLAGKNDRLREEAANLAPEGGSQIKAFGFVSNVPEMMAASDLLITRASPHTLAEARAAGLPTLLLRPAPGVEDRLADKLVRSGAALKAYCEEDLLFLVRELLRNRRALRSLEEAATADRKPDSLARVVDRIVRITK